MLLLWQTAATAEVHVERATTVKFTCGTICAVATTVRSYRTWRGCFFPSFEPRQTQNSETSTTVTLQCSTGKHSILLWVQHHLSHEAALAKITVTCTANDEVTFDGTFGKLMTKKCWDISAVDSLLTHMYRHWWRTGTKHGVNTHRRLAQTPNYLFDIFGGNCQLTMGH